MIRSTISKLPFSVIFAFSAVTSIAVFRFNMTNGANLIADPFYQVDDDALYISSQISGFVGSPMNTVGSLFIGFAFGPNLIYNVDFVTNGTTISGWVGGQSVTDTNTGVQPCWSPNGDVTLLPGMSAVAVLPAVSPTNLPYWFIGLVTEGFTNQISVSRKVLFWCRRPTTPGFRLCGLDPELRRMRL